MSDTEAKYEALRRLLAAAGTGEPLDSSAVLETVCRAVGLSGCAVAAAPFDSEPVAVAGSDWAREALRHYAGDLWAQLSRDHGLESAFLQLAPGGRPQSLFAYPIRDAVRITGVVLGLSEGRRNLALEEDFLLALATALRVARIAGGAGELAEATDAADVAAKAREAAIHETAITVNHEVNNPLTAVLGNTQLLLMQAEDLDPKLRKRLQDIEQSALRIKEVTQKLLRKGPRGSTDYPGGLRMLDLSDGVSDGDGDGDADGEDTSSSDQDLNTD